MKMIIFLLLCLHSQLLAVAQIPPQAAQGFAWKPVEINKQPYVSIDQIKAFYFFKTITINGSSVVLDNERAKIELTIQSQKSRFNGTFFHLSEPVRLQDEVIYVSQLDLATLFDPILRPTRIKNARPFTTVILDAGHGGSDQGAAKKEAALTLAVAKMARKNLEKRGFKVVLTRSEDVAVSLEKRLELINAELHAVVISLHFNSGKKNANGFETYISSAREFNPVNLPSIALAAAVHSRSMLYLNNEKYGRDFEIKDRGIRRAKFWLFKDSKHPTILIEAGFLTDEEEAAKISSEAYQMALAAAITRGLQVYRASIKK